MENILNRIGLKYEDLTSQERETYHQMLESLSKNQITPERLKDNIALMKYSVEEELIDTPEFEYFLFFRRENRKHIYLKARLKNYMLIESFLLSPEKAKKQVEDAMGIGRK